MQGRKFVLAWVKEALKDGWVKSDESYPKRSPISPIQMYHLTKDGFDAFVFLYAKASYCQIRIKMPNGISHDDWNLKQINGYNMAGLLDAKNKCRNCFKETDLDDWHLSYGIFMWCNSCHIKLQLKIPNK
jgi:hypothetical protein